MAKSARDKIGEDKPVKITALPDTLNRWGPPGASMVISTPKEVNAVMASVPKGKLVTTTEIRAKLSELHGTDITCPLTTGIFTNIAAKAAEEMQELGMPEDQITPYWRCLKTDGELNPKYPGGIEHQASQLEAEGFEIRRKGKRAFVERFEEKLASI
ncbi:MGMT family protein [Alphaproteobacteria bacterium]|nr:MGMT family protein [Alphaproteobacteria bacterium]